jgi:hypothetical protein
VALDSALIFLEPLDLFNRTLDELTGLSPRQASAFKKLGKLTVAIVPHNSGKNCNSVSATWFKTGMDKISLFLNFIRLTFQHRSYL